MILFLNVEYANAIFMEGNLIMVIQGRDGFSGEYAADLGKISDLDLMHGTTISTDLNLNLWGPAAYWDDLHVSFLAYDKSNRDAFLSSGGPQLTINGYFSRFSDAMDRICQLYNNIGGGSSVFIPDAPSEGDSYWNQMNNLKGIGSAARFLAGGNIETNLSGFVNQGYVDQTLWYFDDVDSIIDGEEYTLIRLNSDGSVDLAGGGPAPVPEPSTMLLVATGLIGFAGFRKKFK